MPTRGCRTQGLHRLHALHVHLPDKVLRVDDMKGVYDAFLSNWHVTEEMMNAKKSKIITESWQAAS